ncbi:hypothetical protein Catovirus_1_67 [Catovirus CTV1]|uniref:Uncharacterized protein n=1 Tax=Catovirus CTV1 TaxID=1977631 RepID=A0A1V0S8I1_9VIRU|nr:hypothetical protein Catovirus_1_67 [Catovirus CTV1]
MVNALDPHFGTIDYCSFNIIHNINIMFDNSNDLFYL